MFQKSSCHIQILPDQTCHLSRSLSVCPINTLPPRLGPGHLTSKLISVWPSSWHILSIPQVYPNPFSVQAYAEPPSAALTPSPKRRLLG